MKLPKTIDDLCSPAFVYFTISAISTLVYVYHMAKINGGTISQDDYTTMGLVLSVIFYIFWTWILNTICNSKFLMKNFGQKSGKIISWILVILPFILLGMMLLSFYMNSGLLNEVERLNTLKVQSDDDQPDQPEQLAQS